MYWLEGTPLKRAKVFTGIVEEVGKVVSLLGGCLTLSAATVMGGTKKGDSIAVNGACLTVVELDPQGFGVELSPETLRRTNLGTLRPGDMVNLERSVAVGERMGGHIVQGHVDGTGTVRYFRPDGDSTIVGFSAPKRLMPYIVEKGFIAVDGASLTVVKRGASSFTVSVIPYTRTHTGLAEKRSGERVNLEVDIVAKYVESILTKSQGLK